MYALRANIETPTFFFFPSNHRYYLWPNTMVDQIVVKPWQERNHPVIDTLLWKLSGRLEATICPWNWFVYTVLGDSIGSLYRNKCVGSCLAGYIVNSYFTLVLNFIATICLGLFCLVDLMSVFLRGTVLCGTFSLGAYLVQQEIVFFFCTDKNFWTPVVCSLLRDLSIWPDGKMMFHFI